MTVLLAVLEWGHIIPGIFWIGSVAYTYAMILPTLRETPGSATEVVKALEVRRRPALLGAPLVAIALGFLRGLLGGELGPTWYGATFGASLILALALVAYQQLVIIPATQQFVMANGTDLDDSMARLRGTHLPELIGMYLLLALMVAMGFGY